MRKIKILATSDVHGYITPYSYADRKNNGAGLSSLAMKIKELRDENTILVDNGDTLQGSPLLYYHHLFRSETTNPMAKVMNAMNYDYLNTGNHEFNYGFKNAMRFYEDSSAKLIFGNIKYQDKTCNAPYTIHEFPNGIRIALIAAVTDYITNWEQPRNIENVTFDKVFDFVNDSVKLVRDNENVDAIVLLYHGGYERDLESGEPTEDLTGENVGYEMCKKIPGIDVVISGHQHRSIASYCHGVCTTQTALNGQELAVVELEFEDKLIKATPALVKSETFDESLLTLFADLENEAQEWLDKPLGELRTGDLLVKDLFEARVHKHPMVSFLNQVQLDKSGADVSGVSLANVCSGFNHEITMRDIVSTYVFPNTLTLMRMSGAQLKAYIEQCAEYFALDENHQLIVSDKFMQPKPAHYNYDMMDGEGVSYTIKVNNPVGERVVDLKIKDQPVDLEKEYLVCVNNYRASGGGNFMMFKESKIEKEIQVDVVECIADYIQRVKIIDVDHHDNIKVEY